MLAVQIESGQLKILVFLKLIVTVFSLHCSTWVVVLTHLFMHVYYI